MEHSRPDPRSLPKLTRPKRRNFGTIETKPKNAWVHPNTSIPFHRLHPLISRIETLESVVGDKPADWRKPNYGHLDYIIAWRMGWISDEEEGRDRKAYEARRKRSLENCHRPTLGYWNGDFQETLEKGFCHERKKPLITGSYTPELPSHIWRDEDLTDGSRRCLAVIIENTYRANRGDRWLATTVSYLMNALGRSRRTIQNYLRQLEICGYIKCRVLISEKSRMCNGLKIILEQMSFAKQHQDKWPSKQMQPGYLEDAEALKQARNGGIPDAQLDSLNYFSKIYISNFVPTQSVWSWAAKCMMAIYRRNMQSMAPS